MDLDIRIPLGTLFFILGALLVAQGLWGHGPVPTVALPRANVCWGTVMALFGMGMLALAYRQRLRAGAGR